MAPVITEPESPELIEMTKNIKGLRLNKETSLEATSPIPITNNNNDVGLNEDILHVEKLPEDIQELCYASLKVYPLHFCFA